MNEEVEIEVLEEETSVEDKPVSLDEMFVKVKKMNRNRAKARRRKLRAQGFQVGFSK